MLASLAVSATEASASWQPKEDDALLFDVRVGQYRVGNGVRGYQTDSGICVDLGDVIMAFDLPVGSTKSRAARLAGCLKKTGHSPSTATPIQYKS